MYFYRFELYFGQQYIGIRYNTLVLDITSKVYIQVNKYGRYIDIISVTVKIYSKSC